MRQNAMQIKCVAAPPLVLQLVAACYLMPSHGKTPLTPALPPALQVLPPAPPPLALPPATLPPRQPAAAACQQHCHPAACHPNNLDRGQAHAAPATARRLADRRALLFITVGLQMCKSLESRACREGRVGGKGRAGVGKVGQTGTVNRHC